MSVGALAVVYVRDPHQPGSWLQQCPFYALTGLACPFCGGLRSTWDLLHGNILLSLTENPLIIPLIIAYALVIGWWVNYAVRGRPFPKIPVPVIVLASTIFILWSLLRNFAFPL